MTRLLLKICLAMGIAFVLASAASFVGVRLLAGDSIERRPPAFAGGAARMIARRVATGSDEQLARELAAVAALFHTEAHLLPRDAATLPARVAERWRDVGAEGRVALLEQQAYLLAPAPRGQVVVIGPVEGMRPPLSPSSLILVLAVAVFFVVLVGSAVAVPFVRRLHRLQAAAIDIGAGDLAARVDDPSQDAIGDLSRQFNTMTERISGLVADQQHLLRAVSHELRTPLSRARFGLQAVEDAETSPERERALASVEEDLSEMEELVEELLRYHQLDQASSPAKRGEIDLGPTMRALVERVGADHPDLEIDIDVSPFTTLVVEERAFLRAMQNLILNALRHARARVVVRAGTMDDLACVEICDDGDGVPLPERRRVLEPFARLDSSRSRDHGGTGLGLAIVTKIVQAHGGGVWIDDAPEGGARVTTSWPRRATPSACAPAVQTDTKPHC